MTFHNFKIRKLQVSSCRKIIYVTNKLDVGGTERHLLQLLPRLGEQFSPILFVSRSGGHLEIMFEKAGIQVISPPASLGRGLGVVWMALRLCFELTIYRNSIVHFFLTEAYIVGGLCGIITRHSRMIMSRRSLNHYQAAHPVAMRIELWLHQHMVRMLGNSVAVTHDLIIEGGAPSQVINIYNGIDVDQFDAKISDKNPRESLGISNDELLILVVANLIPYKGHVDLINGLASVYDQLPQLWRLVLVGRDDGIKSSLETLASELGMSDYILFIGESDEVESLYSTADIGVLPSHQEGFSNSILEGMAAALPMIVTSVGGNAEAVIDKKTGFVVPPHRPDLLGEAVISLADNPDQRRKFGKSGRERVEELFSLDSCINAYEKVYMDVL